MTSTAPSPRPGTAPVPAPEPQAAGGCCGSHATHPTDGGAGLLGRRRLLGAAGAMGAAVVLAACSSDSDTTGESSTPTSAGSSGETVLGPAADIPVGGGVVYNAEEVVVTQPTAGTYVGLSAICPHQGCLVNEVVDGSIVCPCHGSQFGLDGQVTRGPAATGLETKAVRVQGADILLG